MNSDNLIRMANRIGDFFNAMPDREEALNGVANHIKRFWDPRMRGQLFELIDQQPNPGLSPFVLDAVTTRRSLLVASKPANCS
jgi:formate dehydrogenase subunit delta